MENEQKQYRINPSLTEIGYSMYEYKRLVRNKGTRKGIVDGKEEEISIDERVTDYEDRRTYFKLFKGKTHTLSCLTGNAIKLFLYILENKIEYNKTSFYMVSGVSAKDLHISHATMSKALNDLIDNEVIYRSEDRNIYFINLTIASFGVDEKLYKDHQMTTMR